MIGFSLCVRESYITSTSTHSLLEGTRQNVRRHSLYTQPHTQTHTQMHTHSNLETCLRKEANPLFPSHANQTLPHQPHTHTHAIMNEEITI